MRDAIIGLLLGVLLGILVSAGHKATPHNFYAEAIQLDM